MRKEGPTAAGRLTVHRKSAIEVWVRHKTKGKEKNEETKLEKRKWLEEPRETVRPTSSRRLPRFSPEIKENPPEKWVKTKRRKEAQVQLGFDKDLRRKSEGLNGMERIWRDENCVMCGCAWFERKMKVIRGRECRPKTQWREE